MKQPGIKYIHTRVTIGDTAWELFHRLNREDAMMYLENRADKVFTVIKAVVLAELDGLDGLNTPCQCWSGIEYRFNCDEK